MKKINPEDLVVGQKYLVEMELSEIDHDDPAPYCFGDIQGDGIWFHITQPIYTHEESNDIIALKRWLKCPTILLT
jgi:hypothetical protein